MLPANDPQLEGRDLRRSSRDRFLPHALVRAIQAAIFSNGLLQTAERNSALPVGPGALGSPKYRLADVADASYVGQVMETLSVKLPQPLAKWLIDEANSTQRSRSDLVREALELRRQGKGLTRKTRITMADAMAELRGTVTGPTDLSTNPKHLADFGQ